MNYFLKQPSSSTVVGSFLKAKRGEAVYYHCMHCLRSHAVSHNSIIRKNSNYVKLKLLKFEANKLYGSEKVKKESKSPLKLNQDIDFKKITKIIKLSPEKEVGKGKKTLPNLKEIGAVRVKNKCNIDSTKSYDPSLLDFNVAIEEFYKDLRKKNFSSHKSVASAGTKKSKEVCDEILEPFGEACYLKAEHSVSNKISVTENLSRIQMFKPLPNPGRRQPLIKSEKTAVSESLKNEIDFDNISFLLTQNILLIGNLHSSIDVCILNEMILEAYHIFYTCRKKAKWKNLLYTDSQNLIHVYNLLLHGLSVRGYWSLMKNVTQWMREDDIEFNSETYAFVLYALAKCRNSGNRRLMNQELITVVDSLFRRNIPLNDIFLNSHLTKEEMEVVLGVFREFIPNFEINPVKIDLRGDCTLLKDLYLGHCNISPPLQNSKPEHLNEWVSDQLEIEKKFFVKIKAVTSGVKGGSSAKHIELFDALKNRWEKSLTEAFLLLKEVHKTSLSCSPDWFNLYIYLNSLPVEKYIEILLDTTLNLVHYSGGYSPTFEFLSYDLGRHVSQCYQIRKKEISGYTKRTETYFKKFTSWYLNPHGPAMNTRQHWELLLQDSNGVHQLDPHIVKWSDEALQDLGRRLLGIIIKAVKFEVDTVHGKKDFPVLYTVLRYRESGFFREIKCHPSVKALLNKIGFNEISLRADEMPMLCPPKPWKSVDHGGYLILNTRFIRPNGGVQGKALRLKKIPSRKLFPVFDSLNALQAVPWTINEEVLDLALEVFKNGGSKEMNVPSYPSQETNKSESSKNLTKSLSEIRKEKDRLKKLRQQTMNEYGLWCEALYRLSLAEHFRKKVFWLPQNCDFRGRVYPVPPLLNHLGSDLYRSLLLFAAGKPLGPKGLDWVKIHLINLTGSQKTKSVEDRLKYANEMLPEIIDSATKPLTGNKWWLTSEEPWQTLATCIELKKILSSPNPEEYICRLPIHQDGSCNGLQHYAALGKDLYGAKSVNLVPSDLPQDVYTKVAELIEEERVKDAENGVEIAKILNGFIQRKVVKQTIMTTVYGVTLYGAKLQIGKRLEEFPNFPQQYVRQASAYLSCKTFSCLRKMFISARLIQEWLISCAREICGMKDYVQWVSPLGLPVLQAYGRHGGRSIAHAIVPDTVKQKNGFPPNFIHSLDSCHMMLTALYCEQAGLTFAAVHDCFWTHPNSVDVMNKICREQFISLHSQPILQDLSRFFCRTYKDDHQTKDIFKAVPKTGDFDLKEVMNSVYFFS